MPLLSLMTWILWNNLPDGWDNIEVTPTPERTAFNLYPQTSEGHKVEGCDRKNKWKKSICLVLEGTLEIIWSIASFYNVETPRLVIHPRSYVYT